MLQDTSYTSEHIKVLQSISYTLIYFISFRIFQGLAGCFKILQNISVYLRIFQCILEYFEVLKNTLHTLRYFTYFRIFQGSLGYLTYFKIFQGISGYFKVFHGISHIPDTSHILEYFNFRLFHILQNTEVYFKMFHIGEKWRNWRVVYRVHSCMICI